MGLAAADLPVQPCDEGDGILAARAAPSEEFEQVHPTFPLLAFADPGVSQAKPNGQVALCQTGALPHGDGFVPNRGVVLGME